MGHYTFDSSEDFLWRYAGRGNARPVTLDIKRPIKASAMVGTTLAQSVRLVSLDAFRGFTIALMLLVNNIALDIDTPRQLAHSSWHQMITLADCVFPWFLFCMGIAIPFAVTAFRRKGLPQWQYTIRVVTRLAVLFLLGCLIDCAVERRFVIELGVLQVIGVAYFIAAMVYDMPLIRRIALAGILLGAYWATIHYLPIPGGAGQFEANANAIYFLNKKIYSYIHLWGVPSIVPTTALALLGTVVGDMLSDEVISKRRKGLLLAVVGILLTGAGIAWNLSVPFSKALWTPSFILLTAGLGTLILTIFYWLIDVLNWRILSYPMIVFGSNAIIAYVVPIFMKTMLLQGVQVTMPGGHAVSLYHGILSFLGARYGDLMAGWIYTIAFVALWWLILWVLYLRRMFLRV